jgi:hypothetical protein
MAGKRMTPLCECRWPQGNIGRACRKCGHWIGERSGAAMADAQRHDPNTNVQKLQIELTHTARRQRAQARERLVRKNRRRARY